MYTEEFAELTRKSQAGDRRALTALLRLAHTPVYFQCRALLRNDHVAEAMTRQILAAVPRQLSRLQNPRDFEKWIGRVTASRCMQALSRVPSSPENPGDPPVLNIGHLDELQTARLVRKLVDILPEAPRVCLLLYSCGWLKLKAIAQLTGSTEAQVLEHLNQAQKTINEQLRAYHRMGVHFDAIPALSTLVRTAMYDTRDPKAAAVLVREIMPRQDLTPSRAPKVSPRQLIALAVAGGLLLLLLAVILVLETRGV